MTHGSLFSGIGGFELAASWAGIDTLFNCEWNQFARTILNYHFPDATSYTDITKTDFTEWRGKIDILSGGFPCQPFSVAGQRKGSGDDRYLWPEMLRAIREIRPRWVIGENVAGIVSMVQPGEGVEVGSEIDLFGEDYAIEEITQQYVIETICSDLEREGYSVQPFIIPACSVGAPHRRDRIWIVANRANARTESVREQAFEDNESGITADTNFIGSKGRRSDCEWFKKNEKDRNNIFFKIDRFSCEQFTTDTDNKGCKRHREQSVTAEQGQIGTECSRWNDFPTQSPVRSRDDGFPDGLDGITFSKWRQESIKAYGNAIVPQVAYEIFNAIKFLESDL